LVDVLLSSAGPAVATAYGLGADAVLTGPVARGEMGQVWRLESERGVFAVKDPFFPVAAADAEADAAYQELARAAGLPMPEVVRTPDGRVLVDLDGAPVRVYSWVDVLPRDRRLDPVEVGRLVARLHRVVVPADEPMAAWYAEPLGAEVWRDLVSRLHTAGAPFADGLDALVPDLLALEAMLEPVRATQQCHRDLWADNILRTRDGGLVVLDWESSGPGAPAQELGMVLFDLGLGEPDRIAALHTAYVDSGGPGRVTRPADLTVLVAYLGHITQEGCRRWLASTTDEERRHNEAWVREGLDDPVTLATVELILDAVGSR
jgi:Ser/Thr protein kinase RdoA (MazF antagonist)